MTSHTLKIAVLAACCSSLLGAPLRAGAATDAPAPAPIASGKCPGPACPKTSVRKSKDQVEPGNRGGHQQAKPAGQSGGTQRVPAEPAPAADHQ